MFPARCSGHSPHAVSHLPHSVTHTRSPTQTQSLTHTLVSSPYPGHLYKATRLYTATCTLVIALAMVTDLYGHSSLHWSQPHTVVPRLSHTAAHGWFLACLRSPTHWSESPSCQHPALPSFTLRLSRTRPVWQREQARLEWSQLSSVLRVHPSPPLGRDGAWVSS